MKSYIEALTSTPQRVQHRPEVSIARQPTKPTVQHLSTSPQARRGDVLDYARSEWEALQAKTKFLSMSEDVARFNVAFPLAAWEDALFNCVRWVQDEVVQRELVACAIFILSNIADGIGNHVRSAYFQLVTIIYTHLLSSNWRETPREDFVNKVREIRLGSTAYKENVCLFLDSCHFFRVTGNDRSHDYPPRKLSVTEAELYFNTFDSVFTKLQPIVCEINALKGRGRSQSLVSNASTLSIESSASGDAPGVFLRTLKAIVKLVMAKRQYCGNEDTCPDGECLKSHSSSEIGLYNPDFKKKNCILRHQTLSMSKKDVRKANKECPFNHGDRRSFKVGGFYHLERTQRYLSERVGL